MCMNISQQTVHTHVLNNITQCYDFHLMIGAFFIHFVGKNNIICEIIHSAKMKVKQQREKVDIVSCNLQVLLFS